MRHKFAFAVTTILSTTLFPAAAYAADVAADVAAGSAEMDAGAVDREIIVKGQYLSIDKLNAVKTPTPLIDIPQSLSIIDSRRIADQAFTSIGDITRYTPGVSASQGEGHRDAIIIRGNQTTADFFIDGLRDDVQYYRPLYNLEQVEILRGANALLFGRGGGGGVINRVTKRADFSETFTGVTASVDTFGSVYLAGDLNFAASDSAAVRLNGYYTGFDNHRDFVGGDAFALNPTVTLKAGANTDIVLSYEYVDDDRTIDRGVPSQNVANGPDVPLKGFDRTFFGSPDANYTTLQAHIVKAHVDHTFSDSLRGNFTAQYADYDKLYQNLFASEEVVVTNGTFPSVELDGYRDITKRQNLIMQANLVGEFDTGSFGHTLLFGFEYGDQDSKNSRADNLFAQNGDDQIVIPFTDPLNIPAFSFPVLGRNRASQVEFLSIYLQDQVDVTDWLKIVGGLRFDRFDIDVTDIIEVNDGAADGNDGLLSRKDEEITPRIGFILKPQETLSIYGSYSESFLPRSGDQFLTLSPTSEALEPQKFENLEIGAKWDIRDGLSATLALFRLEQQSVTTVDPLDQGSSIILPGVVTDGIELTLTGRLTDKWSLNTGFSYLDGDVDGGTLDGNKTRQTPETMVSLWSQYQATEQLGLGLGLTHQSSFFVREDNSVRVPGYTRLDAAVFYDVSDALRLQLNVENLTNTDYFPDAHSNDNISTGKPLNARFTISGRF
ncbi:TonB-dependent siderophore receptor [Pacificimonas sp. WHA3]|uniref:TonB-dependent siderophore receptor n=1 Tax=Pacificimonas pallii TaxID=2827236 RepID=A0ABS6SDW2_9SPHN|nr:TonB-dependent siderophore receptor [Pacificimonas pallii]MBV7256589.1 TonB-dependent siderophore receptor [Pacificimonas pallii]